MDPMKWSKGLPEITELHFENLWLYTAVDTKYNTVTFIGAVL